MDILIQEQGDGGEIVVRNNDIVMCYGYENQPYLAQFGGSDWIFNDLFLQNNPDAQFNATTETALKTNPLTSAGLIAIEDAMGNDLNYLEDISSGTAATVNATIVSPNRLNVNIAIGGQNFFMNWSPDSSFLNYTITE